MSMIPSSLYMAHDPWELMRPNRHSWDYYGMDLTPSEFQLSTPSLLPSFRRNELAAALKKFNTDDITRPHVGKDGFQVSLNVQLFKPSEITVKTIDNTVVVEGKHEDRKDDHGNISRHFIRKYDLPTGYDSNQVNSTLSSDGYLTIKASLPTEKELAGKERMIQIQHTGPLHLHVKTPEALNSFMLLKKKDEKREDGSVDPTTNG